MSFFFKSLPANLSRTKMQMGVRSVYFRGITFECPWHFGVYLLTLFPIHAKVYILDATITVEILQRLFLSSLGHGNDLDLPHSTILQHMSTIGTHFENCVVDVMNIKLLWQIMFSTSVLFLTCPCRHDYQKMTKRWRHCFHIPLRYTT